VKCFHPLCTVSPQTGGAVYRINAKGQAAIWACAAHTKNTDAKIDPFVRELVELLDRNAHQVTGDA
jgi:hypothetical protein